MNEQNEILKIISEHLGIDTRLDFALINIEDLVKIFKVGRVYGTPRMGEHLEIMHKNNDYVESALFTLNLFQSRIDAANTASDNMKNYKSLTIELTKEKLENLSLNYKETLARAIEIHKEGKKKREESLERLSTIEKELLLKIKNLNNPE